MFARLVIAGAAAISASRSKEALRISVAATAFEVAIAAKAEDLPESNCTRGEYGGLQVDMATNDLPDVDAAPVKLQCKHCPSGKYNSDTNCSQCQICTGHIGDGTSGLGTIGNGAFECELCPEGTYSTPAGFGTSNSLFDGLKCRQCDLGQYSNQVGADFCKACPSGKYGIARNFTACKSCPEGQSATKFGGTGLIQPIGGCRPPTPSPTFASEDQWITQPNELPLQSVRDDDGKIGYTPQQDDDDVARANPPPQPQAHYSDDTDFFVVVGLVVAALVVFAALATTIFSRRRKVAPQANARVGDGRVTDHERICMKTEQQEQPGRTSSYSSLEEPLATQRGEAGYQTI